MVSSVSFAASPNAGPVRTASTNTPNPPVLQVPTSSLSRATPVNSTSTGICSKISSLIERVKNAIRECLAYIGNFFKNPTPSNTTAPRVNRLVPSNATAPQTSGTAAPLLTGIMPRPRLPLPLLTPRHVSSDEESSEGETSDEEGGDQQNTQQLRFGGVPSSIPSIFAPIQGPLSIGSSRAPMDAISQEARETFDRLIAYLDANMLTKRSNPQWQPNLPEADLLSAISAAEKMLLSPREQQRAKYFFALLIELGNTNQILKIQEPLRRLYVSAYDDVFYLCGKIAHLHPLDPNLLSILLEVASTCFRHPSISIRLQGFPFFDGVLNNAPECGINVVIQWILNNYQQRIDDATINAILRRLVDYDFNSFPIGRRRAIESQWRANVPRLIPIINELISHRDPLLKMQTRRMNATLEERLRTLGGASPSNSQPTIIPGANPPAANPVLNTSNRNVAGG